MTAPPTTDEVRVDCDGPGSRSRSTGPPTRTGSPRMSSHGTHYTPCRTHSARTTCPLGLFCYPSSQLLTCPSRSDTYASNSATVMTCVPHSAAIVARRPSRMKARRSLDTRMSRPERTCAQRIMASRSWRRWPADKCFRCPDGGKDPFDRRLRARSSRSPSAADPRMARVPLDSPKTAVSSTLARERTSSSSEDPSTSRCDTEIAATAIPTRFARLIKGLAGKTLVSRVTVVIALTRLMPNVEGPGRAHASPRSPRT